MIETAPISQRRAVARVKDFGACFFTYATGNGNQFITINLATIISIAWYMSDEDAPVLATVQTQDDIYFDVAGDNAVVLWSCLAS